MRRAEEESPTSKAKPDPISNVIQPPSHIKREDPDNHSSQERKPPEKLEQKDDPPTYFGGFEHNKPQEKVAADLIASPKGHAIEASKSTWLSPFSFWG